MQGGQHRGQRIAELVAHDPQKLVFASPGWFGAHELQPLLIHANAFGQIVGDLPEANQSSRVVAQSAGHDVRPKLRAVLAYEPTFLLEAPFDRRDLKLPLAPSRGYLGARVENRVVLADNLACKVALDPQSSGVPRRDPTVQVERENRVVLDAVDEKPKSLGLLCQLP